MAPTQETGAAALLLEWTRLFQEAARQQAADPTLTKAILSSWRTLIETGQAASTTSPGGPGDRAATNAAWPTATATASDAVDAAIRRLVRRIDELDAYIGAWRASGPQPRHGGGSRRRRG